MTTLKIAVLAPMLVARTTDSPAAAVAPLCDAIHRVDPSLRLFAAQTMESVVAFGLAPRQFNMLLRGLLAAIALVQTYILLANPGSQPADVTVRFLRPSGAPLVKTFTVKPARRFKIAVTGGVGGDVPELDDAAAGTNATATPLP